MSLKKRIIMVFFCVLLLPTISIPIIGTLIIGYQTESISTVYDVDTKTVNVIQNPMRIFSAITKSFYEELHTAATLEPERFEDMEYLNRLNAELAEKYSFIAVRRGTDLVYEGNPEILEDISFALPAYGAYTAVADSGLYLNGQRPMLIKHQDFRYPDGTQGTVFVITDVETLLPQWRTVARQAIAAGLLILVLTGLLTSLLLYRSIARPLAVLRVATNQIRAGNLDYSIHGKESDEIGQLQNDFEAMRLHLKELSDDQIRYEQAAREMMSNVSHDLKTPLTAIKGYTEGLMDGVADTKDKQEKYLRTIYAKACDMELLVEELAFFAKVDSNMVTYDYRVVPIRPYLQDCIEEWTLDLEMKHISLQFSCQCDDTVKVMIDSEHTKRALNNIIENSVKYMDKEEGWIHLRVLADAEFVWLSIEDNGSGIKKRDLPHIFERFYRGDASRGTKKGGTGLGLAIVASIITEQGGKLKAESMEGKGTTIHVSLPRYQLPKEAGAEQKEDEGKKRLWIKS